VNAGSPVVVLGNPTTDRFSRLLGRFVALYGALWIGKTGRLIECGSPWLVDRFTRVNFMLMIRLLRFGVVAGD